MEPGPLDPNGSVLLRAGRGILSGHSGARAIARRRRA